MALRSGRSEKGCPRRPIIKKEDKVMVLSGRDRGKIGRVLKVDVEKERILVEKINIVKRHTRPSAKTAQGGIIEKESPLNISKVMIVCNKCAKPSRVNKRILEDGSKIRICKKCGEAMDA